MYIKIPLQETQEKTSTILVCAIVNHPSPMKVEVLMLLVHQLTHKLQQLVSLPLHQKAVILIPVY